MPLALSPVGISHTVKRIGGNAATRQFLETLGLTIGSAITIITENHGDIIIKIKNSRIAVSKELALKIIV